MRWFYVYRGINLLKFHLECCRQPTWDAAQQPLFFHQPFLLFNVSFAIVGHGHPTTCTTCSAWLRWWRFRLQRAFCGGDGCRCLGTCGDRATGPSQSRQKEPKMPNTLQRNRRKQKNSRENRETLTTANAKKRNRNRGRRKTAKHQQVNTDNALLTGSDQLSFFFFCIFHVLLFVYFFLSFFFEKEKNSPCGVLILSF